ncbi:alternative ribosome rescue aminoacyl-tRNA hydrolase ArfB [candidate division CSSED10-310 bacterium]|uniref:Alternative ribosome rescue aminoacyl-tRNA hydrolase ArfB n=1 Tax=candidate division CSSED10-310 bacterium TaxID=2855610 RepID=A0ABV6YRM7_UNCC1
MIFITNSIEINDNDLDLDFIRSPGPGGQKVNKAATAVQLRFDVENATALPDLVRQRLLRLAKNRITAQGILIIEAHRFRSQHRNRQDALDRFVALVRKATEKPRLRRKTNPPPLSKQRRLEKKRRRSQLKRMRRTPAAQDL